MAGFAVVVEGLETVRDFGDTKGKIARAAAQAINRTARDQRVRAARLIQAQVNLPARYVSPAEGRLAVSRQASAGKLEAAITARGRPTSLARFVQGSPGFNKAGLTVEVRPGQASFMKRAFLIKLNSGSGRTDTQFNAGLAIRLKPGERIKNKIRQVQLSKNLYLLYGPSVQQVFLDNQGDGVAEDISGETLAKLEREFLRLLNL